MKELMPFERIMRELNVIAWAFECQFTEASSSVLALPMIHSKGRYLAGIYHIKSNTEMMMLQDYFRHYTERYENSKNPILVVNELRSIQEKTNKILAFYNENLTQNSKIVIDFKNNIPDDFEAESKYLEKHRGFLIVEDLNPLHIVFDEPEWGQSYRFNYATSNKELALFCQKLGAFIDKFDLNTEEPKPEKEKKRKYTAKHYALSYLFELDLQGKQPPKSDGGFAQSEIDKQGLERYGKTSFTKTIRSIIDFDRNTTKDLEQISKNWREIVLELSPNSEQLDAYLKKKGL